MNTRITFVLAGITAFLSLNSAVFAQVESQLPLEGVTLKGDSLIDVSNRSAGLDFRNFFESQNDQGLGISNSEQFPWSQSIFRPSTPVFLQPASQDVNGNDGLQLQLDLTAEE